MGAFVSASARDPGAFVRASLSHARAHTYTHECAGTYIHRICSSVLSQSGGDAFDEGILSILLVLFFSPSLSLSVSSERIASTVETGLRTVDVVALKRASYHRDALASMSKI